MGFGGNTAKRFFSSGEKIQGKKSMSDDENQFIMMSVKRVYERVYFFQGFCFFCPQKKRESLRVFITQTTVGQEV
ncbi:hypothetical protein CSB09_04200 [Candidatus Gracilibacteria bacterium]|nr:MAG: hypothetical protein CSB09_04200 [Candidatus Gracilibacteria bacterium]